MNKKVYLALAAIAIVTLACSFNFSTNNLFQDNFSDTDGPWPSRNQDGNSMGYSDGGYRIVVASSGSDLFANPGKSLPADVVIEVDATNAGIDNNDFGVVCRLQDLDNFYFFQIASDGYAVIGMYQNDQMYYLSGDSMQEVNGIYSGASTNHIKAVCQGSQLSLYVNDDLVVQATDSTFTSGGDVGLTAGSFDSGGVNILFDNFVVSKP